ncbi:hypothetical protein DLREEDagr8_23310 [Dongia sp. agr-C8]
MVIAGQALGRHLRQYFARDAAKLPLDDSIVTQFVLCHADPAVPLPLPWNPAPINLQGRRLFVGAFVREPVENSVGGILLPGAPRTAF